MCLSKTTIVLPASLRTKCMHLKKNYAFENNN